MLLLQKVMLLAFYLLVAWSNCCIYIQVFFGGGWGGERGSKYKVTGLFCKCCSPGMQLTNSFILSFIKISKSGEPLVSLSELTDGLCRLCSNGDISFPVITEDSAFTYYSCKHYTLF